MKVLSLGNSFSQDAHKWLHTLAAACGVEIETVNLCIAGCSLERHWNGYVNNLADYSLERNGGIGERKISLLEALETDTYDVITLQQGSMLSGRPQSYVPYITKLADLLREKQPQARLMFHQTWAYEVDFSPEGVPFAAYQYRQDEMHRRLVDASEMAAKLIDGDLIPTGTIIQKLRTQLPEFDYPNGGMSLCRDGYHLTLDYGRFIAAVVWFETITGQKVQLEQFEDFDPVLIGKILSVISANEA